MFHVKHKSFFNKKSQDNVSRETLEPKILKKNTVKHNFLYNKYRETFYFLVDKEYKWCYNWKERKKR